MARNSGFLHCMRIGHQTLPLVQLKCPNMQQQSVGLLFPMVVDLLIIFHHENDSSFPENKESCGIIAYRFQISRQQHTRSQYSETQTLPTHHHPFPLFYNHEPIQHYVLSAYKSTHCPSTVEFRFIRTIKWLQAMCAQRWAKMLHSTCFNGIVLIKDRYTKTIKNEKHRRI